MDDLGPPNEERLPPPGEEAAGVVAVDRGERDDMDLGGAAKRELLTGGVSSAIVAVDATRCGGGVRESVKERTMGDKSTQE